MRSIGWKRAMISGVALLGLAGVAVAAASTDAVALLVKFQGGVVVERAGGSGAVGGEVGMQLLPGDRVMVPQGAEAVVLYRTGRLVRASSAVTIEEVAEEGASTLFTNTVRTLGQVATTDARTQPNRQGMIRPIAGSPVPVAPRNGIRVVSERPTFTWLAAPVSGYTIQIRKEAPETGRPVRFDVGSDTAWSRPDPEPPLERGATYAWTVGGEGIGRVAPMQRFKVASADDVATVEAVLHGLAEAGIDPATDGLFLAALGYREAGLYYEALRALDRLAEEGAGAGPSYYMLRGELLDAIGDLEAAEKAFRKAGLAEGA
jgi:hypothetical protein